MLTKFSLFPEQASTMAPHVDTLLFFLIGVTLFFSLLIAGLIMGFMIRFRRRSETERPAVDHGSMWLEVLWTAVPFVIAMFIFFWSAGLYASLRRPPDNALEVNVVGKQWMWKLQHMEGRREINELHIPIGRPVKLTMTSEDVIHSFYVPAFRTKQDVVPGRYSSLWFEATTPGRYHLFCAEYCGTLHSGMIGWVVAMEPAAFQAWLTGSEGETGAPAVAGEHLFEQQGCITCHSGDSGARGPKLTGLYGTTVQLKSGRAAVADEAYIRESILNPTAKVVAGFEPVMPTYQGLLTEEQLLQLIAYLKRGEQPPR